MSSRYDGRRRRWARNGPATASQGSTSAGPWSRYLCVAVADVDAAATIQRSEDRQLTAVNGAVGPIQPGIIGVRFVSSDAQLGPDRRVQRGPPIWPGLDKPQ